MPGRPLLRLGVFLLPLLALAACLETRTPPGQGSRTWNGSAAGKAMAAKGGTVKREDGKVWIEGMDRYRVIDPVFEGIRLILASRGESYSPEYIQGVSGSAFRIGGICPCAPTCDNAMSPQDLIRLLGYEFEHVKIGGKGEELAAATRAAVARVKQEIDAGRAALVWHAFTNAEWDVVYGYDAEKRQFLGRGSYAGNDKPFAEADEGRTSTCGDICAPLGVILIGRKTSGFDARKAELDALQEAVRHARSQKNVDKLGGEKWVMLEGIACYDRWIRDFGKPDHQRGLGDAYCYGVYRSTHRAAAGFLREVAPKYPKGAEHLRRAAGHFGAEANILDKGEKLLWWNAPEGPDAKRNAEAAALLKQARDAYGAGIAAIGAALAAEGVALPQAGAPAAGQPVLLDKAIELAGAFGRRTIGPYHQTRCYVSARCLCLAAAGAPNADYETLMTVSGFGTSFAYHPKHFWVAYWPPAGWDEPKQRISQATRQDWEDLPPAKTPEDAWQILRESVDSGKALMGFFYMGEHVFLGYQEAEKKADRKVLLACPFEYQGEWWPWEKFAEWSKGNAMGRVGEPVPPAASRTLAVAAMARAVASAKGEDGRAKSEKVPPDVKFGLAGIEAFAADVADASKGPEAFDAGWLGCHAIMPQVSGRKCAAVYFRRVAAEFPDEARRHVLAAADAYDAAFAAWQEWRKSLGGTPECKTVEDLNKVWRLRANREAGAAAIRKAAEHERAAVAALAQALAAEAASGAKGESGPEGARSKGAVKREGGKVWVEGVPTLGWGKHRECTFAGALEAALAATARPYRYADLMGYSGLAFRVRWYQAKEGRDWCPSSPVGEFPEEQAAISKATGWELRCECLLGQKDMNMERFVPTIVASIDAGKPVPAYDRGLNMAVVYGYQDGGKTRLLHDYSGSEAPVDLPASKLGPMAVFLSDSAEPLARRAALLGALKVAVRNWRREPICSEKGQYWYGEQALAHWSADLGDADKLSEKEREKLFFVSWWNFSSLADARRATLQFLSEGAGMVDGEGREALERAVALYQKECGLLGPVFDRKEAFLGPWSGKSIKDWTPDVRKREQEMLGEARQVEAAAIAEVEKALAVERAPAAR